MKNQHVKKSVAALGILLTSVMGGSVAHAGDMDVREVPSLTVVGEGRAVTAPQQVVIQAVLEEKGPRASGLIKPLRQKMMAAQTRLKEMASLPPEALRTEDLSVNPEYTTDKNGQSVQQGFAGRLVFSVRTSGMEQASEVLDKLTSGTTDVQIQGLRFEAGASPQTGQLYEKAVQNAKEKAEAMAQKLGITLGQVIAVQDMGMNGTLPMASGMMEKAMVAASPLPPAADGSQSVQVAVKWHVVK